MSATSCAGDSPQPIVQLVGAGPGDPELLTVKAIKAIRSATVLLVDDLVGPGVLRYARRSTRIVRVGKRGGCASTPQAFIEKLMTAEALKGERVVRLKGGDPFVFGRGGEEADHLRAQGIRVEVISGITSGLAAAATLGAPLTHREHAHGVMFVTGHGRSDDDTLHWPTLAAAATQGAPVARRREVRRQHRLAAWVPRVQEIHRAHRPRSSAFASPVRSSAFFRRGPHMQAGKESRLYPDRAPAAAGPPDRTPTGR